MPRYDRDYGPRFGFRDQPDSYRRGRTGRGWLGESIARHGRETYRGALGGYGRAYRSRERSRRERRLGYGGELVGGGPRHGYGAEFRRGYGSEYHLGFGGHGGSRAGRRGWGRLWSPEERERGGFGEYFD